jgi:hypothetical protein
MGVLAWRSLLDDGEPRAAREANAEPDSVAARIESLEAEVKRLRVEQQRARTDIAELRDIVSGLPLGTAEPSAAAGNEPANGVAAPDAEKAAYESEWQKIADQFSTERSDARWDPSPELSRKILAVMPPGASLRALDCRASMCRLETAHPSRDSYADFAEYFTMLKGDAQLWTGSTVARVMHEPQHDGDPLVAIAYLHRSSFN